MRVCLAQINTTPGDFEGNLGRIKSGIDAATVGQCDAIIFPELTIPGYLSQDLMYNTGYVDRNLAALQEVCDYSRGVKDLNIVVGYIGRNRQAGKPFFNMAAVIRDGDLVGEYKKMLLPFYDVFDELRYFEPGHELTVVEIAGKNVGIAICEDLWNDKGSDDYDETMNPMSQYREKNVDVIFSLNSSPYVQGKCWQRFDKIAPGAASGLHIVYVNQLGGQDELVFDGQSFVLRDDELIYLSTKTAFDSFDIVDLDSAKKIAGIGKQKQWIEKNTVPLYEMLVLCLRDYAQKCGFEHLVLASSGGIDSAVVCKIACDALGAKNVHAIRMPSVFSSDHSRDDAIALHQNLGCWDYEVPVEHSPVIEMLNARYEECTAVDNLVTRKMKDSAYNVLADENMQARLRDVYVMHFSNAYGAMPLSTGNKTESACGYYTHFDMNFSFAPIKDLYKFQVVDIARENEEIPVNIWQKPPSAELSIGQFDEDSLLPYAVLDPIVFAYVEDYISTFDGFLQWVGQAVATETRMTGDLNRLQGWIDSTGAKAEFNKIVSMIGRMEYKRRQTCPGTKVSKVAFGIGRRIPIVEKWL